MSHVSYLARLVPSKFKGTVAEMAAMIRDKFPKCNALFGRGLSGEMIIPALAAELGVEWIIVRKGRSHSDYRVEASLWPLDTRAVFVDDLIDSGASFRASLLSAKKGAAAESRKRGETVHFKCLGAACYSYECSHLDDYRVFYTESV